MSTTGRSKLFGYPDPSYYHYLGYCLFISALQSIWRRRNGSVWNTSKLLNVWNLLSSRMTLLGWVPWLTVRTQILREFCSANFSKRIGLHFTFLNFDWFIICWKNFLQYGLGIVDAFFSFTNSKTLNYPCTTGGVPNGKKIVLFEKYIFDYTVHGYDFPTPDYETV